MVTLRLAGEAYRVVQQMSPEDCSDSACVMESLKEAYEALCGMHLSI